MQEVSANHQEKDTLRFFFSVWYVRYLHFASHKLCKRGQIIPLISIIYAAGIINVKWKFPCITGLKIYVQFRTGRSIYRIESFNPYAIVDGRLHGRRCHGNRLTSRSWSPTCSPAMAARLFSFTAFTNMPLFPAPSSIWIPNGSEHFSM